MSARFNAKLNDAEWAAYQAGGRRADRTHFMNNARLYKRLASIEAMKTSVRAARDCNRCLLKAFADYATAAKKPARKRA